jgi:putative transcriptional regulator
LEPQSQKTGVIQCREPFAIFWKKLQKAENCIRAGCTRQTIILMEQSRYVPSLALAFRIARVFKAKIVDIFEYVE